MEETETVFIEFIYQQITSNQKMDFSSEFFYTT
jgi:hypothetical protein